jgi:S-formylglutathione hydrolase FrmB
MATIAYLTGIGELSDLLRLTGLPLLVLVCLAAVALPVLAVAGWSRWRWLRVPRTTALLVTGQVLVAFAFGLAINRSQQIFTSWSDLLGVDGIGTHAGVTTAGDLDARVAEHARRAAPGHGVVLALRLHGPRSGITLPAWVYLPPQYSRPAWRDRRFPVIEALDGFPGSPQRWLDSLHLKTVMDTEIAAGRMRPTVVVLPEQSSNNLKHDSECVNQVGGPQYGTYLTTDLRHVIDADFRVIRNRYGWGLTGYSTGGFCAANLALRPGYGYAAAASLSGVFAPYLDGSTGNLFDGSAAARHANDPDWQVRHARHLASVAVYAACAAPDPAPCRQARTFAAAARGTPVHVTLMELARGGHTFVTWRAVAAPALDFLSDHLVGPTEPPAVPDDHIPTVIPRYVHHHHDVRAGADTAKPTSSPTP